MNLRSTQHAKLASLALFLFVLLSVSVFQASTKMGWAGGGGGIQTDANAESTAVEAVSLDEQPKRVDSALGKDSSAESIEKKTGEEAAPDSDSSKVKARKKGGSRGSRGACTMMMRYDAGKADARLGLHRCVSHSQR